MLYRVFFLLPLLLSFVRGASPVDARIAAARKAVVASPKSWQPYNDLAFALCRKARDNGDVALYDEAAAALRHSNQLSPGNYDSQKLQVPVLLGRHEFAEALKLASDLNHKVPDDIGVWGLLVDANLALGNYADAERDAQWILDLRPGSALGFEKAAALREMFGDFEGAIEFLDEANRRTSQNDAGQRAWLLTESARLQIASNNPKRAGELLTQALNLFPDSQLAIANLAVLRKMEGNDTEAAALLERRYRNVPNAANLYAWAEALEKSGRNEQASLAFREFEAKARAGMAKQYNANLELIYFYAGHQENPAKALALAAQETAIRHDSQTLDAYAWALYRNGKYAEAKVQMDRALAVGVRNPAYFCHAAQIASALNDEAAASRFEKELADVGASSCPIGQVTQSARENPR